MVPYALRQKFPGSVSSAIDEASTVEGRIDRNIVLNILGFTPHFQYSHDTSAALVCDGVLVVAAEEERFSRQKHAGKLPLQAMEFCLHTAGITMSEVDFIAYPSLPFKAGPHSELPTMDMEFMRRLHAEGRTRYRRIALKRLYDLWNGLGLPPKDFWIDRGTAQTFTLIRQHFGALPPIRYYAHHLAHAAATYLSSPWDRSAVVVAVDGAGGSYSTVTWAGESNAIRRLRAETAGNSIGLFYNECTMYAGLGEFGEGKFMGLAPYGDKERFSREIAELFDFPESALYRYRGVPTKERVGFDPRRNEPITSAPYPDFAAACQAVSEKAISRVVNSAIKDSGARNLCLSGGVIYNCSSNGSLLASNIADSIWIFPAAGDAGISVGAALLCSAEVGELKRGTASHPYWGPGFTSAACEAALRNESRVEFRAM